MSINTSSAASSYPVNPPPSPRRHDLDSLRTCLTGLVIVHHATITFSGPGSWPYRSTMFPGLSPISAGFQVFNQSFFMGLFFWMSGRGSAQSLASAAKRSGGYMGFVRGRVKRLVLPAVVYSVFVDPLVKVVANAPLSSSWFEVGELLVKYAKDVVVSCKVRGPVWYLATLAVFDIVAVGIHQVLLGSGGSGSTPTWQNPRNNKRHAPDPDPTVSVKSPHVTPAKPTTGSSPYRLLSTWGWIPVALTCFALRQREPVPGMTTPVISLQLGFAPQYVYAYVLGHMSLRYGESRMVGPLDCLPLGNGSVTEPVNKVRTTTTTTLPVAATISLTLLAAMLAPILLSSSAHGPIATNEASQQYVIKLWRSSRPLALFCALWGEFSFVLMGPALMQYFQIWYSSPPRNEKASQATGSPVVTARNAYVAFLVHAPVTVVVARAVDIVWLSLRQALGGSSLGFWFDTSRVWNEFAGPVLMTTIVGSVGVYASFLAGKVVLRRVPGAKRIL